MSKKIFFNKPYKSIFNRNKLQYLHTANTIPARQVHGKQLKKSPRDKL